MTPDVLAQLGLDDPQLLAALGFDARALQQQSQAAGAQEMERARAEACVVQDALGNEAGRRFLQLLAQWTVLRPPTEAELSATSVEQQALLGARRVARNNLYFVIASALTMDTAEALQGND